MLTDKIERGLRLVRVGDWWGAKIPPLLLVGYLTLLAFHVDVHLAALRLAAFLVSVVCVAAYGHVINDAFDIEVDRRAGKPNRMVGRSARSRVGLCLSLVAAGCLPALVAGYSSLAWLLLLLNFLWPTLYSAPPVRLKERGLLGVVCDAAGSHLTPTLLAIAVCSPQTAAPPGPFDFRIWVALWACAQGIKGILHHELADRENDLRSGVTTFATQTEPAHLEAFLPYYNLCVELPVSCLLAVTVIPWCPLIGVALVAYCAVETLKFRLGFQFALTQDPRTIRASVPFANEAAYTFWLPLAGALQLAVVGPQWWWVPALHVVAFPRAFSLYGTDLRAVWCASLTRVRTPRLSRGWKMPGRGR